MSPPTRKKKPPATRKSTATKRPAGGARTRTVRTADTGDPAKERIQKVLAAAGYGSRRACEALVEDGHVEVNGKTITKLPILVDPRNDRIRVNGSRLRMPEREYYLLHKPKGVLCTNSDPAGRRRAIDLLQGVQARVFPVGRLDADSSGLLLMTNDGELAELLTHPRYGVEKTYEASIKGRLSAEEVQRLKDGVWLAEGKARSAGVKLLRNGRDRSLLEIRLREGRNRQVRRMLARLGHKVLGLKRTRIGHLRLRGLGPGSFRPLTFTELQRLHKLTAFAQAEPRTSTPQRARAKRPTGPAQRSRLTARSQRNA